jgi:hypothetical protein
MCIPAGVSSRLVIETFDEMTKQCRGVDVITWNRIVDFEDLRKDDLIRLWLVTDQQPAQRFKGKHGYDGKSGLNNIFQKFINLIWFYNT